MTRLNSLMIRVVALLLIGGTGGSCGSSYSHEVIEQYDDGTAKVIHYYKEKESGKELYKLEEYYDNGVKRVEGYFSGNERHGRWNSWHENGQLWSVATYRDGKLHGKQTVYFPSGNKFYEGAFENGLRTGTWTFWDEDGKVVNTREY
ncbi:MAG: hypothetical protein R6V49_09190 [Bacteroidales bacterium]